MITLDNTLTANTFTCSFSERLNQYGIDTTTGDTFYIQIVSIANPNYVQSFNVVDLSPFPFRFNHFNLTGTITYPLGQYEYTAFADSAMTQELETGRLLIVGTSGNNIYS